VTATLYTEDLLLSIQYRKLSLHIWWSTMLVTGEGYGRSTQYIWQAQLSLRPPSWTSPQVTEFPVRPDIFNTVILWLGTVIKLLFLLPTIQNLTEWVGDDLAGKKDDFRRWGNTFLAANNFINHWEKIGGMRR
jgi:hypothetical protein